MKKHQAICLHEKDNVAVVQGNLEAGDLVEPMSITLREAVPQGHKVAIRNISAGQYVKKYGQIIGLAGRDILTGEHVHTHNVGMGQFERGYEHGRFAVPTCYVHESKRATFQGYRRANGKVGTRNYVGIVTSVNCAASVAQLLVREAEKTGILERYPNIDGIVPIVHGAGCCIATDNETFYKLQRALWGYATHPNFSSVLMIGLGCEANQIPLMLENYGASSSESIQYFTIQQAGGTRKSVERGMLWLENILKTANRAKRETVPAKELTLALQCGGSDGYSGISANPALGHAVDMLVRHGGCAALAETPEIYGAEHLLVNRAQTKKIGEKLLGLIRWWEDYAGKHHSSMNNNPTPGNKAGGLTTILEKSLGAVAKGGSTNLTGVYQYGELITEKGLVFMDSPGYDPVSLTGEVASGCNLICFTTGRGSCYGNKPVPSIKIASNTPMFNRMNEDMDINCGTIIDGEETIKQAGERIFEEILNVASGKYSKSEIMGYGDAEFTPWQTYAQM